MAKAKEHVLHRNLLLSCEHLPSEELILIGKPTSVPEKTTSMKKKVCNKATMCKTMSSRNCENAGSFSEEEQWIDRCRYIVDNLENLEVEESEYVQDEQSEESLDEEVEEPTVQDNLSASDVLEEGDIQEDENSDDTVGPDGDFTREYDDSDVNWNSVDVRSDNPIIDADSSLDDKDVEMLSLNRRERSKRNRRPPRIFTYDEKGEPIYQ